MPSTSFLLVPRRWSSDDERCSDEDGERRELLDEEEDGMAAEERDVMDSGACGEEAPDEGCAGVMLQVKDDNDDGLSGVVGNAPVPVAIGLTLPPAGSPLLLLPLPARLADLSSAAPPSSYSCSSFKAGGVNESSVGSVV